MTTAPKVGKMFIVCDGCSYRSRYDAGTEEAKARLRTRDHHRRLNHTIRLYYGSKILISLKAKGARK